MATILFTDVVGSTELLPSRGDRRWREALDTQDATARTLVERFGGKFIKTTGDGLLATFEGPGRAIRCAFALQSSMSSAGIQIRAGIHTGEIELRSDDVGGLAVHIGARVLACAGDGEVWCSRTVKDLVAGSGIEFEDKGLHALKGVPDEWQLFVALGG